MCEKKEGGVHSLWLEVGRNFVSVAKKKKIPGTITWGLLLGGFGFETVQPKQIM